jgi:3,4-dihydroxy 2-butanone 4-phosphate synthase
MSSPKFDSIEDSIAAFKNGDFIVVLDSTDRENEGDLLIAAQDLTTEKMAFMVRYTRYEISSFRPSPVPPPSECEC